MGFRIRWAPRAVSHLEQICKYISQDSGTYARIFAQKVLFQLRLSKKSRYPLLSKFTYNKINYLQFLKSLFEGFLIKLRYIL